jgi:integrase
MASLEKRGDQFRIVFRFAGQRLSRSLKTTSEKAAVACVARLEDNLRRAELGLLTVPDDADVVSFLLSDGRSNGKPKLPAIRSLKQLCEGYVESLPAGAIEESTLEGMEIQMRHLRRILGDDFAIRSLELADLHRYVDQRSREKGRRGRTVSAVTIKKDLTAFSTLWTWARHMGAVEKPFPKRGLKFPKTTEKPAFQTIQEIERKIARGGLTEAEEADLWDFVFLTLPDIAELLTYVARTARHPFIYPMFVFAAHTGARRSEMMRSRIDDIDLATGTVIIHEKKRARGKLTTRRVPLSPMLSNVLGQWLSRHPGGSYTFCLEADVPRSRTKKPEVAPIRRD